MKQAIRLVEDLNNEFYLKTNNTEWIPFSFDTDGTEHRIMFLGYPVFSTAADYINEEEGQTLKNNIMVQVAAMINDLKVFDENRDKS